MVRDNLTMNTVVRGNLTMNTVVRGNLTMNTVVRGNLTINIVVRGNLTSNTTVILQQLGYKQVHGRRWCLTTNSSYIHEEIGKCQAG